MCDDQPIPPCSEGSPERPSTPTNKPPLGTNNTPGENSVPANTAPNAAKSIETVLGLTDNPDSLTTCRHHYLQGSKNQPLEVPELSNSEINEATLQAEINCENCRICILEQRKKLQDLHQHQEFLKSSLTVAPQPSHKNTSATLADENVNDDIVEII